VRTGNERRAATVRILAAFMAMLAFGGSSCSTEEPRSDLEYLVWEVCRQVRTEGMTPDQVSGILHDASRHGAVMEMIETECGQDIAAIYSPDP